MGNPLLLEMCERIHWKCEPWRDAAFSWHVHLVTLFRPMEFCIKLHTIKSGWSIFYIEGSKDILSHKNIVFLAFKNDFILTQHSEDPDEMSHCAAFHHGLHCLSKYPFRISCLRKCAVVQINKNWERKIANIFLSISQYSKTCVTRPLQNRKTQRS